VGYAGTTAVVEADVEAEAFPFTLAFLDGIAAIVDVDGFETL